MKSRAKWALIVFGLLIALFAAYGLTSTQLASNKEETGALDPLPASLPSSGRVTMLDLGATECIPCKMMAPIIEELKKEYADKADIIFIDVWKNPDQAKKYGIRAIPTQIFFDADGRELFRNSGFLAKKRIVELLKRLGVS